ncbi:peptidylprolyl isomerase [Salinisphaera sp. PC39]|uniref:peptidylprolyl isomerase n=1 Tax=Salinisphaera sp. PC39 TaxID=1304156 RepID=UPI0033423224
MTALKNLFRQQPPAAPRVTLATDHGDIVLALDGEAAPRTVANFLAYAGDGFYDGTVFHRVIAGFMIQGGGHDTGLAQRRPGRAPVRNESDNGLRNRRGTVAMARTPDPHSATSQFFINLADNTALDAAEGQYGYTVFGRVVEGMDTVDAIAALPTGPAGPLRSDVPRPLPTIETVRVEADA